MSGFGQAQDRSVDLTVCVVGNILGRNEGYVTTQGQVLADRLIRDGYKVICASSRVNRFLRLADIVATIVRNRKVIDLIILEVYSGPYFIIADIASGLAKLFYIPVTFVLHGGNLPTFSERFPAWVRRVLSRANVLVAPSMFLARGLSKLGMPIRVIPNIVDIASYPFRLRKELQPKLIWMRAFHEIYNPKMAVRTLELVRRKYPDASLVMAGVDKGLEQEVRDLVTSSGMGESVRFPGFLGPEDKIREFSDADIFLNTNRIDNMPVAVLEARAIGLPVVSTDVGGLRDLISDRESGMLVPDDDAESMADAVVSLLENREIAERISTNGREIAERSSWEIVRNEWEQVFEVALNARSHSTDSGKVTQVTNT